MQPSGPCVDWLKYRRASAAREDRAWSPANWQRALQPGDLVWADPVTATCFVLAQREAERITRTGLALLGRHPGNLHARTVLEYLYDPDAFADGSAGLPPEGREALELLPELPAYPAAAGAAGDLPRPARLGDLATLHAALLWAMDVPEVRADWEALRRRCLLAALATHAPAAGAAILPQGPLPDAYHVAALAAAAATGQPLTEEQKAAVADRCGAFRVSLAKAHTIKVKAYFLQTNRIPSIRGASLLLDSINRERYPRYFDQHPHLVPEGLIYTGGAGALAVVPLRAGEEAAREWERLHEKVTLVARSVAVHASASLADVALHFPDVNGRLEGLLHRRRGAKLDWWLHPDFAWADINLHAVRPRQTEVAGWQPADTGQICRHCGLHRAWRILPTEDGEPVCAACAIKWDAGRGTARTHFTRLYSRSLASDEAAAQPQTLLDLAAQHGDGRSIAVIYGDGNNMGDVLQRVDTAGQLRQFSQQVERSVYQAVFPALAAHLGTHAVEFIALGGDDLFFIMPADAALTTAAALVGAFDRAFYNLSKEEPTLTMSVGVAVAEAHTPIAFLFAQAEEMLKAAKKRARNLGGKTGTLEIARLDRSAGNPAQRRELQAAGQVIRRTLRPLTWRQALALAELVQVLHEGESPFAPSLLYTLRETIASGEPEEADLLFRYHLSRRSHRPEVARWLERYLEKQAALAKACGAADASGPFWTDKATGARVTPWLDVLELWDTAAARSQVRQGVEHGAG